VQGTGGVATIVRVWRHASRGEGINGKRIRDGGDVTKKQDQKQGEICNMGPVGQRWGWSQYGLVADA
jgi:hypothetical protein